MVQYRSRFIARALCITALLYFCSLRSTHAQDSSQNPTLQQLKDKLQDIQREMNEVQDQIKTLENTNPAKPTNELPTGNADEHAAEPTIEPVKNNLGTIQLYGFVQMDSGYRFGQIDPAWFDVIRPTKMAAYKNQFGPDGSVYFSVRQTRFGVKTSTPTNYGDLKTQFEFELFGTGVDAGQTTFRLRHAWGELKHFGAGQYWSPFMDIDVFPNSLEYWGPNGMVFFRNVQFRWTPVRRNDLQIILAAERPGASADGGIYSDRIELSGVTPKFDMPDFSWQVRTNHEWGYLQVAGIFRKITWVDNNNTPGFNIGDTVLGWGINTTTNLKFTKKDNLKMGVVYGAGVQNYMNDAPVDVSVKANPSQPNRPIKGVALPMLGATAFLDHDWSTRFSSTIGASMLNIWNSNRQSPQDFHQGDYALTNLLYYPVRNVMVGGEFQFGRRVDFSSGWNVNDYKIQLSAKYNFSKETSY